MKNTVAVFGCGAWGLTLADYLARRGTSVICWDRNEESVKEMRENRTKKGSRGSCFTRVCGLHRIYPKP